MIGKWIPGQARHDDRCRVEPNSTKRGHSIERCHPGKKRHPGLRAGIHVLCAFLILSITTATASDWAHARIVAQENARLERAKQKKRSWIVNQLLGSQRKSFLLERAATIAAWQERVVQEYQEDESFGKYAHLYPVPAWPLPVQFSFEPTQLRVDYQVSRANRGTTVDGAVVDIAQLALGTKPLVKDILVASAMSGASDANQAVGYEFLKDLADTPLMFSASHVRRQVLLSYAYSVSSNALTFGVTMPLVEQMRHVRVWPDATSAVREQLRDRSLVEGTDVARNDVFRELYGINISTFFEDVLAQKGMRFEQHVHQFSVGDITAYVTASMFPKRLERFQVGASIELPVAKKTDDRFFYPLELGNGGFVSATAYAGVLSKKTEWGHLHAMASWKASFPATVIRRVPRQIVLTGVGSLPSTEVFGAETTFDAARDVNIPETTLPHFAQQTTSITLRPGFAIDVRAGSVITPCVFNALQADLYYHFHARTADQVQKNLPADKWYTAPFVSSGYRVQHTFGTQLTYQPTANFHLRAGLSGVVISRGLPLTWTGSTALSYSW